jgi:hypothetical protein
MGNGREAIKFPSPNEPIISCNFSQLSCAASYVCADSKWPFPTLSERAVALKAWLLKMEVIAA